MRVMTSDLGSVLADAGRETGQLFKKLPLELVQKTRESQRHNSHNEISCCVDYTGGSWGGDYTCSVGISAFRIIHEPVAE